VEEELEEARRKKLEGAQQALEAKKIEEQLKSALRIVLSEKAYARMMNVRISSPQLYAAASKQVLGAYGKVRRQISEEELLSLLKAVRGKGRETKITFK
jgi:DNA-binding TFAR19-related protein (PDSD5 family)